MKPSDGILGWTTISAVIILVLIGAILCGIADDRRADACRNSGGVLIQDYRGAAVCVGEGSLK